MIFLHSHALVDFRRPGHIFNGPIVLGVSLFQNLHFICYYSC